MEGTQSTLSKEELGAVVEDDDDRAETVQTAAQNEQTRPHDKAPGVLLQDSAEQRRLHRTRRPAVQNVRVSVEAAKGDSCHAGALGRDLSSRDDTTALAVVESVFHLPHASCETRVLLLTFWTCV